MDGARFDQHARGLAARGSRRGLVGALVGSTAGLALPTTRRATAACPPDQVERRGTQGVPRCVCKTTGRPPGDGKVCPCPNGLSRCGGGCVDTRGDAANCGACDVSCDDGDICTHDRCVDGQCRHVPFSGQPDDACTDDVQCPAGYVCHNGGCFISCRPNEAGRVCGAGCRCAPFRSGTLVDLFCLDIDSFIGRCASDADCPVGTGCSISSGTPDLPGLCTLPCCAGI
jgi:hypothetical protein